MALRRAIFFTGTALVGMAGFVSALPTVATQRSASAAVGAVRRAGDVPTVSLVPGTCAGAARSGGATGRRARGGRPVHTAAGPRYGRSAPIATDATDATDATALAADVVRGSGTATHLVEEVGPRCRHGSR